MMKKVLSIVIFFLLLTTTVYGQSLGKTTNSEVYTMIYNSLINLEDKVDLSQYNLSSDEAFAIREKVIKENPEIFYFEYKGSVYWSNGILENKYILPKNDILVMLRNVQDKADEIINQVIKENMTDFEKVVAIHDYLVKNTAYDSVNYHNNTTPWESYGIYGALIKNTSVCAGYAESMLFLLKKLNIECIYITGYVNSGFHGWNIVKIDDDYYHIDATWDDSVPDKKNQVKYKYLLLSDESMSKDHSWNSNEYPPCTNTKYSFLNEIEYFQKVGDYFYYSNSNDDNKLYKIKTDGSNKSKVSDNRALYLAHHDDWIYYSNYSYGGYIFKIKLDGSEDTLVKDKYAVNLYCKENQLYYTLKEKNEEYSLPLESKPLNPTEYTDFEEMENVSPYKTFVIKFNDAISYIGEDKVYVTDEYGNVLSTILVQLSWDYDYKAIEVSNTALYENGKTYYLYVEKGIVSRNSEETENSTKIKFTISE